MQDYRQEREEEGRVDQGTDQLRYAGAEVRVRVRMQASYMSNDLHQSRRLTMVIPVEGILEVGRVEMRDDQFARHGREMAIGDLVVGVQKRGGRRRGGRGRRGQRGEEVEERSVIGGRLTLCYQRVKGEESLRGNGGGGGRGTRGGGMPP